MSRTPLGLKTGVGRHYRSPDRTQLSGIRLCPKLYVALKNSIVAFLLFREPLVEQAAKSKCACANLTTFIPPEIHLLVWQGCFKQKTCPAAWCRNDSAQRETPWESDAVQCEYVMCLC